MSARYLFTAPARHPIAAFFGAVLGSIMILTVPVVAHWLEPLLLPVNTHWHVEVAQRDGDDLLVSGSMKKHRACVFLPPTIARDEDGNNYRVIHQSRNGGSSWAPDEQPQRFGPWRVVGGAGKKLEFINVFQCHSLWPTFSELGDFDARGL